MFDVDHRREQDTVELKTREDISEHDAQLV